MDNSEGADTLHAMWTKWGKKYNILPFLVHKNAGKKSKKERLKKEKERSQKTANIKKNYSDEVRILELSS